MINAVTGPIHAEDLGFTLMHEHIMVCAGGLYRSYPDLLGPNREERAIAALKEAKAAGIDTFVDATTFDLGPRPGSCCGASRRHPASTSSTSRAGGWTCRASSAMSRPSRWRVSSCATSRRAFAART